MLDELHRTKSALMTALPAKTGSTPTQRTMVIPSTVATAATAAVLQPTDETQVLGARGGSAPRQATTAEGSTIALTRKAQQRRRRGWWLVALVAVLVVAASGTG